MFIGENENKTFMTIQNKTKFNNNNTGNTDNTNNTFDKTQHNNKTTSASNLTKLQKQYKQLPFKQNYNVQQKEAPKTSNIKTIQILGVAQHQIHSTTNCNNTDIAVSPETRPKTRYQIDHEETQKHHENAVQTSVGSSAEEGN